MQTARLDTALLTLKKLTDELTLSLPLESLKESLRKLRLPGFGWPSLRIGEKVARVPVVQGGMGVGISLSGLASAVAEAGGIGIIAANAIGMLEKDYYKDGRAANLRALRREIREARSRTDGLIGVNIMVAVNDFHELLDVAIEERVDLILMGAGLPVKDIPVAKMRENGVKAVPIVSSARAAEMIFRMWKKIYKDVPDAVVCEGPLAGGHLGFSAEQIDDPDFQIQKIIPTVVEAVRPFEAEFNRQIPVIAAGGIYTGADIYEEIGLGASGVQMGTRFVATDECDADEKFKQAYVDCTEDQIGLIKSPVGMPGRAIRNEFITDSEAGKRPSFTCAWQCLASCKAEASRYCISIALNNARKGRIDKGFVFVGANAHRVKEIVPVATLINELAEGFRVKARESVTRRLDAMVARVRDARDSGVEQIQKRYDEVLAGLRELRMLVTEGMSDSSPA
ncbi:MAG TPA: nitronate monooxygenase [Spirochaetia bacterium]|nr:nitronate monooxygenase [Spirochaetia bacterium]